MNKVGEFLIDSSKKGEGFYERMNCADIYAAQKGHPCFLHSTIFSYSMFDFLETVKAYENIFMKSRITRINVGIESCRVL